MSQFVPTSSKVAAGDRRRFHRIEFDSPVSARFGGETVALTDIGVTGAAFVSDSPWRGVKAALLEFEHCGVSISVRAEVRSCCLTRTSGTGRPIYRSGVRFCDTESPHTIRDLMLQLVVQAHLQK